MSANKTLLTAITMLIVLGHVGFSNAKEIVLCLNTADQYLVIVSEKGDCVEGEKQITMTGPEMAEKKNMTPIALFENNDECKTVGSVTKIGFDKNGNNSLDEGEIESVSKDCALAPNKESED